MAQTVYDGFQALDSNGDPISGALLYSYEAGTTTEKDVWTDAALSVAHANPIVADSAGRFGTIYVSPDIYKFVLQTAAAVEIWTDDNKTVPDPVTATAVTSETITGPTTVAAGDLDRLYNVDASSGDVTVTANSATLGSGFRFSVKLASATNNAIIQPGGGQTVDGQATYTISVQYNSVSLVSNGAGGWDIISQSNLADIADYTVLGNVSGAPTTPDEVTIKDDDTMADDSATSLVTQQSVKAYVDTKILTAQPWTFIEEITGTGTNLNSTADLSSYDLLKITILAIPNSADDLFMQVSTSGGFLNTNEYYFESEYDIIVGGSTGEGDETAHPRFEITDANTSIEANTSGAMMNIDMTQFAAAQKCMVTWGGLWQTGSTSFGRHINPSGGFVNTTTALTAFRFGFIGGATFVAGSGFVLQGRAFS